MEKGAGTEVLNVIELNSKPHNFTSQDVVSVNLVSSTTTKQIVENRSTNENQLERSTFPGLESPSSQMDGELIGAGSGYSEVEKSPVILTNTEVSQWIVIKHRNRWYFYTIDFVPRH